MAEGNTAVEAPVAEAPAKEQMVLYTTYKENDVVKKMAAEDGLDIAFDREKRAYVLDVTGADPALTAKYQEYASQEAKEKSAQNRDEVAVQRELKAAAKEKEVPIEKALEGASNVVVAYVSFSQREEFNELLKETGSTKRYVNADKENGPHWKVGTEQPDKFAAFTGPEASARFKAEYAERDNGKSMNTQAEASRGAVKDLATKFFNANIKEGYRLPDPQSKDEKLAEFSSLKIREMSAASTNQIQAVLKSTNIEIAKLINKEREIRAEVAGVSPAQMKEYSFEDQRKMATVDGKVAGLDREDGNRLSALRRGQSALTNELVAREVAVPTREKQTEAAISSEKAVAPVVATDKSKAPQVQQQDKGMSIEEQQAFVMKSRGQGR